VRLISRNQACRARSSSRHAPPRRFLPAHGRLLSARQDFGQVPCSLGRPPAMKGRFTRSGGPPLDESPPPMLVFTAQAYDAMIAHRVKACEIASCGILAGIAPTASVSYPLRNVLESPARYFAVPRDLDRAHKDEDLDPSPARPAAPRTRTHVGQIAGLSSGVTRLAGVSTRNRRIPVQRSARCLCVSWRTPLPPTRLLRKHDS
jgi:hypothetical protein